MKKIVLIFIAFACLVQVNAQNEFVESFYTSYKDMEDVTSFNLGGNFLKNLNLNEDGGNKFESKLEQLYILSLPYSTVVSEDLSSLKKSLARGKYEELVRYRSGKEWIGIYIQEDKDAIKELLILVEDPDDDIVLVTLTGEMQYEDLNQINIDGDAGDIIRNLPSERKGE